ncbi:MAG: ATP F0F1 synthase subunit B [Rhizomicrobium sp.]
MELVKEILQEPDFWEGLGLLIVIGMFLYLGVPGMITGALDKRARDIEAELTQALQLREEAEVVLTNYRERAKEAGKEAETILKDAKADAERFAEEARVALKAQLERRAKQAQDRIAQAERQALLEIRTLAADAAAAAAEKIIGSRIDDQKAGALIAQSLGELPAKLN